MRHITRFAAALALAVPLFAVSGTAQARDSFGFSVTIGSPGIHGGYGYHGPARYRILPPHVIRATLRASYREVSRPERRGDVYIARAEDRRGKDLIITVNAYTGRVIDVRYARRGRHDGHHGHWKDRHDDRWDDRRDDRDGDRDGDWRGDRRDGRR